MFSIIVDQLRFKKLPIGSYDGISTGMAWVWMVLIGAVMNSDILMYEKNILMYVLTLVLEVISIYSAYLIMVWWLGRKGYFDGNGNLWGLMVTSSTVDMAAPFAAIVHPMGMLAFSVASLAIFYNALKSGLGLTTKVTIVTIVIVTVFAMVLGGILGTLAAMSGLPIFGVEG